MSALHVEKKGARLRRVRYETIESLMDEENIRNNRTLSGTKDHAPRKSHLAWAIFLPKKSPPLSRASEKSRTQAICEAFCRLNKYTL